VEWDEERVNAKGFLEEMSGCFAEEKDFLAVERDVGGDEQIVGNVLRQIPSNEPRSKGGPDAGR
jgi:hypothetical protein